MISRREFLACSLAASLAGAGRKPNLIHFLADDVGYDDIGCFGAKGMTTPNLDRMAAAGMRFTDFYAPASVCTPSRAAILTGRYSCRLKPMHNILFPGEKGFSTGKDITIGTLLRQAGYRTALIGKWHCGDDPASLPPNQGFDHYFGTPYANDMGQEMQQDYPPFPLYRELQKVEEPADLPNLPDKFAADALRFIEENRQRPFFLHYANIETHTPWFVPERFHGKAVQGAYGDAIQCMDWAFGQIVDKIRQLGLERDTLIVFSSDNGPLAAESPSTKRLHEVYGKFADPRPADTHLLRGYKGTSHWEGGPRVPAFFAWPGVIKPGSDCHAVAGGMDLFTTFAALAGVPLPSDRPIDGKSLLPLLRGEAGAASPHEAFFSYGGARLAGVRRGQWKLSLPPNQPPQLYDLEADLRERKDVSAAHPEVMRDMLARAEEGRRIAK